MRPSPSTLLLERGGRLPRVTVAYETYGTLNAARDNAVLICHALSGDSHVARHDDGTTIPAGGTWSSGRARRSTPSATSSSAPTSSAAAAAPPAPTASTPETGRPYGRDFPVITVGDMVQVQKRLIDHLGIERLLAVVGGSLGGHMVLTWATRFPDRVAGAVALATSPRLTSQALAFDVVGRNAILRDPAYHGGQYYDQRQRAGGGAGAGADARPHHLPVAGGDDAEVRRPAAAARTTSRPSSRTSSPSAPTWPTRATSSSSVSTPTAT